MSSCHQWSAFFIRCPSGVNPGPIIRHLYLATSLGLVNRVSTSLLKIWSCSYNV